VLAAEYDVPSLEFLPSIHNNVQITFCIPYLLVS
jgi:hypothetical protein